MTSWTIARQAPLSMGFSRQEYWSGLPFLSPGDLPDPRIETTSHMSYALHETWLLTAKPLEKPHSLRYNNIEIRPINNPTVDSEYSNERKCCTSLALNKKLEMIKLSEEGALKAQTGRKLGFLDQFAQL